MTEETTVPALLAPCSSCGAQIRWARVKLSGRRMPLDPDPHEAGNVELLDEWYPDGCQAARVISSKRAADAPTLFDDPDLDPAPVLTGRYRSHFATCPYAPRHRRG